MLNAERAQGMPTIVTIMISPANTQPTAIHRPPNTIQRMLRMRFIAAGSRVAGRKPPGPRHMALDAGASQGFGAGSHRPGASASASLPPMDSRAPEPPEPLPP